MANVYFHIDSDFNKRNIQNERDIKLDLQSIGSSPALLQYKYDKIMCPIYLKAPRGLKNWSTYILKWGKFWIIHEILFLMGTEIVKLGPFFIITKSDSENWVWMPIQNFEKFSFLNFLSSQWQCMVQIGKSHCLSPIAIFKFLNFSKLSKTGHIILLYLFIKFVPKFQKWSNIDLIWTIFQFGPSIAEKTSDIPYFEKSKTFHFWVVLKCRGCFKIVLTLAFSF